MISLLAKARIDGIKKKKGGKMMDYFGQKSWMIQQHTNAWGCTAIADDRKTQQSAAADATCYMEAKLRQYFPTPCNSLCWWGWGQDQHHYSYQKSVVLDSPGFIQMYWDEKAKKRNTIKLCSTYHLAKWDCKRSKEKKGGNNLVKDNFCSKIESCNNVKAMTKETNTKTKLTVSVSQIPRVQ